MHRIVVGSRGSRLAVVQTRLALEHLRGVLPHAEFELREIKTEGDRDQRTSLSQLGGRGVFVKEIETALRSGEIDLAVHSLKDLPTVEPPDLVLAAIPPRASPLDAVYTPTREPLSRLLAGSRVATSSPRRAAQLRAAFPTLRVVGIRGNVDTRLRKVDEGEAEAVVLARAGLDRLGLKDRIVEVLDPSVMLPAPGQGALACQVRAADRKLQSLLGAAGDPATTAEVTAERAFLGRFGSGCATPIAALGRVFDGRLTLEGLVITPDGAESVRLSIEGPPEDAADLGRDLAERCLAAGASRLIEVRA